MTDRSRHELANRMVTTLPRFGYWAVAINEYETPFGKVGYRQLEVLWAIRHNQIPGDAVTATAIADYLSVQPSVVTRVLAKLETHGFVTRVGDPHDGRRTHIEITGRGIDVSVFVEELYNQEMLAELAGLDDAQLEHIAASIDILDGISERLLANRKAGFTRAGWPAHDASGE